MVTIFGLLGGFMGGLGFDFGTCVGLGVTFLGAGFVFTIGFGVCLGGTGTTFGGVGLITSTGIGGRGGVGAYEADANSKTWISSSCFSQLGRKPKVPARAISTA
jgi:hypothetical protein